MQRGMILSGDCGAVDGAERARLNYMIWAEHGKARGPRTLPTEVLCRSWCVDRPLRPLGWLWC